jgi:hypothetical protein
MSVFGRQSAAAWSVLGPRAKWPGRRGRRRKWVNAQRCRGKGSTPIHFNLIHLTNQTSTTLLPSPFTSFLSLSCFSDIELTIWSPLAILHCGPGDCYCSLSSTTLKTLQPIVTPGSGATSPLKHKSSEVLPRPSQGLGCHHSGKPTRPFLAPPCSPSGSAGLGMPLAGQLLPMAMPPQQAGWIIAAHRLLVPSLEYPQG